MLDPVYLPQINPSNTIMQNQEQILCLLFISDIQISAHYKAKEQKPQIKQANFNLHRFIQKWPKNVKEDQP